MQALIAFADLLLSLKGLFLMPLKVFELTISSKHQPMQLALSRILLLPSEALSHSQFSGLRPVIKPNLKVPYNRKHSLQSRKHIEHIIVLQYEKLKPQGKRDHSRKPESSKRFYTKA